MILGGAHYFATGGNDMPVKTYRRIPNEFQAIEWLGDNYPDLIRFMEGDDAKIPELEDCSKVVIQALEGNMTADIGDFIIRGCEGEFHPCKPNIFWKQNEELQPCST